MFDRHPRSSGGIVTGLILGSILLSSGTRAADDWTECFDDGDVFDGVPIVWRGDQCTACTDSSKFDAATGDLVLRSCYEEEKAAWLLSQESRTGDVSLRFQARLVGEGELWPVVQLDRCGRCYCGIVSTCPSRTVGVGLVRFDDGQPSVWHERKDGEIREDEEYVVQVDRQDDVLRIRAWSAAGGRIESPVADLIREDPTHGAGRVGIGYLGFEPDAHAIIRYLWVSDHGIAGEGSPCSAPPPPREWCDDFEDGEVFDAWTQLSGGEADALTGDLILRPEGVEESVFLQFNDAELEGDLSMRVRGRIVGLGRLWFWVHSPRGGTHYGAGIERMDKWCMNCVRLSRRDSGEMAYKEWVSFETDPEQDYLIQLDVVGEELRLRAWAAEDDTMPEEPQVTVIDSTYRQGSVGIGYTSDEAGSYGVFNYVWVSDDGPLEGDPPCQTSETSVRFTRCDGNADGEADLSDALLVLNYLFAGGPAPRCEASGDCDDSGVLEITDAVYLLGYLFLRGPAPPQPFPDCGRDPDIDDLTCESYSPCE